MEIIKIHAHKQYELKDESVACIGFFDGVHRGHQYLIHHTIQKAKKLDKISACITFDVDPWVVLRKDTSITNLMTVEERLELIQKLGIERCYLLHFDESMASLSKENFVALLKEIKIIHIFCGQDFRFGNKNEGDIHFLKETMQTTVCDIKLIDKHKISSSSIEKAIQNGDLAFVKKCLGYHYNLKGNVVLGKQIGRTLGFPTANISLKAKYVIPKKGVYSGYVEVDKQYYKAMINIGHNPTLNHREDISIEANILDFDEMIYDKEIRLYFVEFIRDEIHFGSREELIEQLCKDVGFVRRMQDEVSII